MTDIFVNWIRVDTISVTDADKYELWRGPRTALDLLHALEEHSVIGLIVDEPPTVTTHTPRPWMGICSRCGTALNNLSPGFSIVLGGAKVCALCLRPGEEIARAK